jgi:hypothetical protein
MDYISPGETRETTSAPQGMNLIRDLFKHFRNGAKSKAKRFPGRPRRMQSPTVTTINVEKTLLTEMKERAYRRRQSVSQWVTEAVLHRIEREDETLCSVEREAMTE